MRVLPCRAIEMQGITLPITLPITLSYYPVQKPHWLRVLVG
jgi:hypothetical protein